MAYRNDVEALEARLKNLESEVGDKARERDEVAALLAEARARDNAERYVAEAPQRKRRQRNIIIATLVALGVLGAIFGAMRLRNRTDEFEVVMAKFEQFSEQMCACRDAACATKVSDELTKWAKEMARKEKDPPKMDEAQMKKATELGQRMGECMQKAMGMGEGPQPVDEPSRRSPEGE